MKESALHQWKVSLPLVKLKNELHKLKKEEDLIET